MMHKHDDYGRGYGHGMMGGYGHNMMGGNGEYGPMHDGMITAFAEALDLTAEEIEARHDAGETLWEIAEAKGLSAEEIQAVMFSAHDLALEDAIANGYMTSEQAEWMNAHMDQMWSGEYGAGGFGGHCGGQGMYNNNSRWESGE
jgi:hypothetical protein